MKRVVIAEKPSVARDLAAALGEGNLKRQEGALVGGTVAFTWCLGHLCELVAPETYRPEWKRWRLEHLPMVPKELDFRTAPRRTGAKRQLKVLRQLTKDAGEVVNACDAGREGELIFWWAMRANGWGRGLAPGVPGKGRVSRLWLASMTEGGIREAWEKRRPISEYGNLAAAAAARAEADWLLGLNLTRAATLVLPREQGDPVWPIGRVQTPVLAAVVRRDLAIERFEPQPFWRIEIGFAGEGTPYTALLDAGDGEALGEKAEQFASRETAAERLAAVRAHAARWEVLDEAKERQEKAPALFSLTALQREAAKRCGWSAKETLGLAQSLYEKGLVTYPRTEASCLPDDYRQTADVVAQAVAARLAVGEWTLPSECAHAARVFNSTKVSDHFAIIPTDKPIAEASFANANEERLWQLVAQRFLLAFAPDAVALQTRRTLTAGKLAARAKGKVYRKAGWRALAASFGLLEDKAAAVLPALSRPHDVAIEAELKNGQTKPPAAFNEASLLGLMERIASVLEDEAASDEELKKLRAAIGERGLGTPATRAEILEGLIRRELMERTKAKGAGKLTATSRGRALIAALDERGAEALTLPLKTAQWEESLQAVERGQRERLSFLEEIEADVRALAALVVGDATDSAALALTCPKTGEPVLEEGSFFVFPGWPRLKCWKTIAKRPMSAEDYGAILRAHLEQEPSDKLTGFVSNKGKPFAARLELKGERFAFKFE